MSIVVYLDESGDLGWTLDKPYRSGGSSRFLTIGALLVPSRRTHLPKRCIKRLYEKHRWEPSEEKKWSDMTNGERTSFAEAARTLAQNNPDIQYLAITVRKENVQDHIRQDKNKLYNYMINLLLTHEMAKHDHVTFVPDPRSIKVSSGNSLHDYLQTNLWFEYNVSTRLHTLPCDSQASRNVQFADMLSGVVQSHIEDRRSPPWDILSPQIAFKRLFF